MNTTNYPLISIPKPCHEDWSKMTPDEQGAFCKVCSKSVIDFSTKNADEIKAIIQEKEGTKMCGRFRTDQLAQPVKVEIPLWLLPKRLSPVKAFLIALLVSFGSALISCTNTDGQVMGKYALVRDSVKHPVCNAVKGEVEAKHQPITGDTVITEPLLVTGFAIPQVIDSVNEKEDSAAVDENDSDLGELTVSNDTPVIIRPAETDTTILYTLGGLSIITVESDPVSTEDTLVADSAASFRAEDVNREGLNPVDPPRSFQLKVLSNPTAGKLNLKLMMNVKEEIQLDLYDLAGRKLRSFLPPQHLDEGEYNMEFDISALPSGTILCITRSNNYQQSPKIVLSK